MENIQTVNDAGWRVCVASLRMPLTREQAIFVADRVESCIESFEEGEDQAAFDSSLDLVSLVPGSSLGFSNALACRLGMHIPDGWYDWDGMQEVDGTTYAISDFAIARRTDEGWIIYAYDDGLYESSDFGKTWLLVDFETMKDVERALEEFAAG